MRTVIAVVMATLIGTSAYAAEQKWAEYKFKEDRFAISEPVPPRTETRKFDAAFGPVTENVYAFFPGPEGVVFTVHVNARSEGDHRSDDEILAFSVKSVPPDAQRVLTQSGVKGVEFAFDNDAASKTLMRIFVRDGELYILQLTGLKSAFPHPLAERWLNSWRLLAPDEK